MVGFVAHIARGEDEVDVAGECDGGPVAHVGNDAELVPAQVQPAGQLPLLLSADEGVEVEPGALVVRQSRP